MNRYSKTNATFFILAYVQYFQIFIFKLKKVIGAIYIPVYMKPVSILAKLYILLVKAGVKWGDSMVGS